MKRWRQRLAHAEKARQYVSIRRKVKFDEPTNGYIVGVGTRWAVVALTTNGGHLDGHQAFRIADVKEVKASRSFLAALTPTRAEWPPAMPKGPIRLGDTAEVVQSFAASAPLIGIEQERERNGIWIGTLDEVTRKWVYLNEVDFEGEWKPAPLGDKLKSITSVSIHGQYLDPIFGAAGPRPTSVDGHKSDSSIDSVLGTHIPSSN